MSSILQEDEKDRGPKSVPKPWMAFWDEAYERYYYFNPQTKISTWLHPVLDVEEGEDVEGERVEVDGDYTAVEAASIAEADEYGWIECFDEVHNIPYWFNVFTETSTWYKPPEVESRFTDTELQNQRIRGMSEAIRKESVRSRPPQKKQETLPAIPDPAEYGYHFPDAKTLPPPPTFGGTTKVYPSLIASDELHAPRYFMDYDLRGKTELPTKSNKYGIMFKATHDTEDLSWVARWFALEGTSLRYFKSHEDYPQNPLDGIRIYGAKIRLFDEYVTVSEDVGSVPAFSLLEPTGERVVDLALRTKNLHDEWIRALCHKGAKVIDHDTIQESLSLIQDG